MGIEFDIACLRAPCEPGDTTSVVQLIARAKMAADQLEELTAQRDELLAALKETRAKIEALSLNDSCWFIDSPERGGFDCDKLDALIERIDHA